MTATILLHACQTFGGAVKHLQQLDSSAQLGLLDVDGVASMNHDIGWRAGDQVIQAVGAHLQRAVASTEATLFHIAGDKFLIVAQRHSSFIEWLATIQCALSNESVQSVDHPDVHLPLLVGVAALTVHVSGPWSERTLSAFLTRAAEVFHPRRPMTFVCLDGA